jgi:agmatine deiminase
MKDSKNTPSAMGFSMPAEWELHEATWLAWPHNPTDWPGKLDAICWVYGEIVHRSAVLVGQGVAQVDAIRPRKETLPRF